MTRIPKTGEAPPVASPPACASPPGASAGKPGSVCPPAEPGTPLDPAAATHPPIVAAGSSSLPLPSSPPATAPCEAEAGKLSPAGGTVDADAVSPAGSKAFLNAHVASKMSEAELEGHVRCLIKDLGLLGYHTRDSRGSAHGFPDWVIVGDRVIYRELKTTKGRVTDSQAQWLRALVLAEQDACVWRPADLLSGLIGRQLAALAGLRTGAA